MQPLLDFLAYHPFLSVIVLILFVCAISEAAGWRPVVIYRGCTFFGPECEDDND